MRTWTKSLPVSFSFWLFSPFFFVCNLVLNPCAKATLNFLSNFSCMKLRDKQIWKQWTCCCFEFSRRSKEGNWFVFQGRAHFLFWFEPLCRFTCHVSETLNHASCTRHWHIRTVCLLNCYYFWLIVGPWIPRI